MELKTLGKSIFLVEWGWQDSRESIEAFLVQLKAHPQYGQHTFCLSLPYIYLEAIARQIDHERIHLGCREMNSADPGAFTASITALMLKRNGAEFGVVGAIEKRLGPRESNESINFKVNSQLAAGITPFLSVGETDAELQAGKAREIIREQYVKRTAGIAPEQLSDIAYLFEAPWVRTTLDHLTAETIVERYAQYSQVVEECVGAERAESFSYFYRYSPEIEHFERVYSRFRGRGFYLPEPASLWKLLDVISNITTPLSTSESHEKPLEVLLENEIPLPLDIDVSEFESELTISSGVLSSPPPPDKVEEEQPSIAPEVVPPIPDSPIPVPSLPVPPASQTASPPQPEADSKETASEDSEEPPTPASPTDAHS